MTTVNETSTINHEETAHLAYLNWQKDGCPAGRDLAYWLEAEQQLKATKHLLAVANEAQANGPKAAAKPKTKGPRKPSLRPALAHSV